MYTYTYFNMYYKHFVKTIMILCVEKIVNSLVVQFSLLLTPASSLLTPASLLLTPVSSLLTRW